MMWEFLAKLVNYTIDTAILKLVNDAIDKTKETMENLVNTKYDTLTGAMGGLWRTIQVDVLQPVGDMLIPYVEKGITVIDSLASHWNALDPATQKTIIKFAAVAAATGPVLMGVGKISTGIGGMITNFGKVSGAIMRLTNGATGFKAIGTIMTGPVGIAIAAIAAKIEELKASGGITGGGTTGGGTATETMEYVDLGLPSGKKWSKKYLGAETATDKGDYYAWGETSPKSPGHFDFTKENYKLLDGAWGDFRRYNKKDGWKQLIPYDDAATARLGDKWHIPTETEVQELLDYCTAKEITMNGKAGIALVSKINNNYIFFRNNGLVSFDKWYGTDRFDFWTADLFIGDVQHATYCRIYIDGDNIVTDTWHTLRSDGMNIRPIYY